MTDEDRLRLEIARLKERLDLACDVILAVFDPDLDDDALARAIGAFVESERRAMDEVKR